jgi:outer membrane biosynthesis protein TonB
VPPRLGALFALGLLLAACSRHERAEPQPDKVLALRPPYERNTERKEFIDYLRQVAERMREVWVLPERAVLPADAVTVRITFALNTNGTLRAVQVPGGEPAPARESALAAMRKAEPFQPMPPGLAFMAAMENLAITVTKERSPKKQ